MQGVPEPVRHRAVRNLQQASVARWNPFPRGVSGIPVTHRFKKDQAEFPASSLRTPGKGPSSPGNNSPGMPCRGDHVHHSQVPQIGVLVFLDLVMNILRPATVNHIWVLRQFQ